MNTKPIMIPEKEEDLFTLFINKYFPYWPLFLGMVFLMLLMAWAYLRYATPIYSASATLIIKDENKGVDEARMTESIDAFASKKIVENEIEVIQSRALMRKVATELNLYAPIYEERQFKDVSAYISSPVIIQLKDPKNIQLQSEADDQSDDDTKLYLRFVPSKNQVEIAGKLYPLDQWVNTPYGEMQFLINPKQSTEPTGPLFFELKPLSSVTSSLLGKLEVSSANKLSTVVNIELRDEVPQRGEDILNQLIHNYNNAAVQERNSLAANTMRFIEDRMVLIENELDILETKVQQYKSSRGIVDLSEQGRVFLQSVSENDRRLADINLQLAVLDKVENYVISKDKASGIVPSTLGLNDEVLTQLLQKLYDTEMQYQRLGKTTAENNPLMFSIKEEIDKIRPSILENIRNQRETLLASQTNLASTKGNYNVALQTIPQKERELLEISRQQAIKNEIYSFLLQKREETALSYAPSTGDSKVVDMAESYGPVSPNGKITYLIAFALAFVLSIVAVTGKDLLNSKVLYRTDIEQYTNIPIVAELSNVKTPKGNRFRKVDNIVVIEQFRQLRTSLGLYSRSFSKKKIMITSNISGEGKSFVSSNLAYSLATSGKKVVLVDLDLRNPSITSQFGMLQEMGVTNYLDTTSFEVVTIPTEFENLYVLPAGTKIGDHTELLLNGKLEHIFSALEKNFDYLIIDTPPVDLVADGFLISEYCDINLLVIRHAYTPKGIIKYLAHSNKNKSINNLAIVFNGVRTRGFTSKGYGYGYGYHNLYGQKSY